MKNQFKIAITIILIIAVAGIYYSKNIYGKKDKLETSITNRIEDIMKVHNGELKKLVIMQLSTKTCPNCVEMYPIMNSINEKYGDRVIVGVVYLDDKKILDTAMKLARKYEVMYVPTIVFLDKDGRVVSKKVGVMTEEEILDILSKMEVI